MTDKATVDRERANALMMAVIDGESTTADQRELDELVAGSPDLGTELARLRRVKEVTTTMTLRQPSEETWDGYWRSVYNRTERGIAWLLVSLGAIVVGAWGVWQALEDLLENDSLPVYVRMGIFAVALGFVILALSVVREKFFTHRRDPYEKEVTR